MVLRNFEIEMCVWPLRHAGGRGGALGRCRLGVVRAWGWLALVLMRMPYFITEPYTGCAEKKFFCMPAGGAQKVVRGLPPTSWTYYPYRNLLQYFQKVYAAPETQTNLLGLTYYPYTFSSPGQ